jgi:hypothetical protein
MKVLLPKRFRTRLTSLSCLYSDSLGPEAEVVPLPDNSLEGRIGVVRFLQEGRGLMRACIKDDGWEILDSARSTRSAKDRAMKEFGIKDSRGVVYRKNQPDPTLRRGAVGARESCGEVKRSHRSIHREDS